MKVLKVVKLLEDLYTVSPGNLDDYAWLSQEDLDDDYRYARKGDCLVYDEIDECYINHSCSIPNDFIDNCKHEVFPLLELIYLMKDQDCCEIDVSNLRGESLKRFMEIDIDNYKVQDTETFIDDSEIGISIKIEDHWYSFGWVGAEPLAYFKYKDSSDAAKKDAECFLRDARIELIKNLIG